MIGIDTNILIRYLTQDDPLQSKKANTIISQNQTQKIFLNLIVICETVWVLESAYQLSRIQIGDTLEKILRTLQFQVQNSALVWQALSYYNNSKADFSDCLIALSNQANDCKETLTFDQGAKGIPKMKCIN